MKQLIFKTEDNYAPLILRVSAGIVMVAHGSQKLLGLFGGFGFTASMNYFTQTAHLPWIIGFSVILIEFFGSIALIAGLATRLMSAALSVLIIGILLTSHVQNGFFMNWFGVQKGEGMEFGILFLAISVSLSISGGGKWSADRLLNRSS